MTKKNKRLKKELEDKTYSLEEAVDFLKNNYKPRFDETVEIHFRLGIDPSKTLQLVKGSISLPHGPVKSRRIAIFSSDKNIQSAKKTGADIVGGKELIEEIKETGKADFDIALADPDIMSDLAIIARILGPKGLMPSPKAGTVTSNFSEAVESFRKGKINFRNDESGNVHLPVGKLSWDKEKIIENIKAAIEEVQNLKPSKVKKNYIKSITISSTMGPGIKISL